MHFKKYKQIYHEFVEDAEFIDNTIKNLNLEKNSKVLDIGTGIGAMSILVALNGFNVLTGEPKIDSEEINEEICKYHKNPYDEYQENNHSHYNWIDWRESAELLGVQEKIEYQNFNVEHLPFNDNYFNAIFMYDTLQHIKKRDIALKECLRVLKINGILIVLEWTEKAIEKDYLKYGYKIEFIDPRQYINNNHYSYEVFRGEFVNIYTICKIK